MEKNNKDIVLRDWFFGTFNNLSESLTALKFKEFNFKQEDGNDIKLCFRSDEGLLEHLVKRIIKLEEEVKKLNNK